MLVTSHQEWIPIFEERVPTVQIVHQLSKFVYQLIKNKCQFISSIWYEIMRVNNNS